jgi:PD-(D/E)XK nuclease superfamily
MDISDQTSPTEAHLLQLTHKIIEFDELIARETGRDFNIFEILNIQRREVTTHSPMLAELLDPKGRHGQGTLFLNIFLAHLDKTNRRVALNTEGKNVTLHQELHIGYKTETSGGRIDIVIHDANDYKILIENKIDACDQENQLLRYHDYCKTAPILYITLEGKKPDPDQVSEDDIKNWPVHCLSYRDDIRNWLQDCIREVTHIPNIREGIAQYLTVVKNLTNQSSSNYMKTELYKTICHSPDTINAFLNLVAHEEDFYRGIISSINDSLKKIVFELEADRKETWTIAHELETNAFRIENSSFSITTDYLREVNLSIGFSFESPRFYNFYYGFAYLEPVPYSLAILKQ